MADSVEDVANIIGNILKFRPKPIYALNMAGKYNQCVFKRIWWAN